VHAHRPDNKKTADTSRTASALDKLYFALDLAHDDPLAFNSLIGIGLAHFQVGRYLEATRWLQRAIA
jgi:hypothetical protein